MLNLVQLNSTVLCVLYCQAGVADENRFQTQKTTQKQQWLEELGLWLILHIYGDLRHKSLPVKCFCCSCM